MKDKKRKTANKALLAGVVLVTLSPCVLINSGIANAASGSLSAIILAPVTVAQNVSGELIFGSFTVSNAIGTVNLDTANSRNVTGGVTDVPGAGIEQSGVLKLTGSGGVPIQVTMSGAPSASFTVSNGTSSMLIDNFNLVTAAGGNQATVTITVSSISGTFPIGATLNVKANQPAGTYVGTYSLTANYI